MTAKVILLIGPAGSGKTSIARRIAKNDGWVHISEDDLWVAIKRGHPPDELRTSAEQAVVQRKALGHPVHSRVKTDVVLPPDCNHNGSNELKRLPWRP